MIRDQAAITVPYFNLVAAEETGLHGLLRSHYEGMGNGVWWSSRVHWLFVAGCCAQRQYRHPLPLSCFGRRGNGGTEVTWDYRGSHTTGSIFLFAIAIAGLPVRSRKVA